MATTPKSDDLRVAAQWLDIHEGAEDAQACRRVATWLVRQADAADFRESCRQAGVTVSKAREIARRGHDCRGV